MSKEEPLLFSQGLVLPEQFFFPHQTELLHLSDHRSFGFPDALGLFLEQLDLSLDPPPPLYVFELLFVVHVPIPFVIAEPVFVVVFELFDGLPFLFVFVLHLVEVLPQLPLDIAVLLVDVFDEVHLIFFESLSHQILKLFVLVLEPTHLFLLALL